jgi:hypothetical protein
MTFFGIFGKISIISIDFLAGLCYNEDIRIVASLQSPDFLMSRVQALGILKICGKLYRKLQIFQKKEEFLMITERKTEVFDYNPEVDIEDADLVFEDFDGANDRFNSFRAKTIVKCLSMELKPEAEAIVTDGFRNILLGEETEWYVFAVQPLPGTPRIRLRHHGAQIVGDYGKDEVDDKVTVERKAEYKRIKEILDGYEVDLTLSWKPRTPEDGRIWFGLTIESGEEVGFEVDEGKTTIEVNRGLFEGSMKYVLTWKNSEHTKIRVKKTHTFCL